MGAVSTGKKDTVTKEQFLEFIQSKDKPAKKSVLAYYEDAFERSKEKRFFIDWNWAAFLLNFYWMAYRGMYLYAVAYVGAGTIPYFATMPYLQTSFEIVFFALVPAYVVWVAFGLYGTSLYVYWAKCKISEGKHVGVSFWRVFVAFLVYLVLGVGLTTLFMAQHVENPVYEDHQGEPEDILQEF